jgi:hypothetical protein
MSEDGVIPVISTGLLKLIDVGLAFTCLVVFSVLVTIVAWKLAKALKITNDKFIEVAVNSNNVLTKLEIAVTSAIRH